MQVRGEDHIETTETAAVTVTGLSPIVSIIALLYLYSDPRSSIYPRLQSPHHTGYGRQQ